MANQAACTTEEKVPVTASPKTAAGNPAQVDGALKVTVQSGEGTVEQDPAKPLEFFAVSSDTPGTTEYLIEADADLGAGVEAISDTLTLVVSGAKAANFGVSTGAAVPKTVAPPA